MNDYRRVYQPGGCYFFTVVTRQRRPLLAQPVLIERLKSAFREVIAKRPFEVEAMVVLPDHLHCLWQLPDGDADFATRWRLIKHYVSVGVGFSANDRNEKNVWQRRYWEHLIQDEEDWRRHMDYIHYNPVKHGYVEAPGDWLHSSFRRFVRHGWYAPDWGRNVTVNLSGLEYE